MLKQNRHDNFITFTHLGFKFYSFILRTFNYNHDISFFLQLLCLNINQQ